MKGGGGQGDVWGMGENVLGLQVCFFMDSKVTSKTLQQTYLKHTTNLNSCCNNNCNFYF